MKIAGLVDVLNLFTDIPFTEFAWSEAPEGGHGVVSADGQDEFRADADPVAEKMLTGYVDVYVKASDPDPTDDVEGAMRAIGVWFSMESIQLEPETGFLHFEWRWKDMTNTVRKAILNTLPLMLHIASATWSDGDLFLTFEERAAEIYDAIGTRDITFYVPVEEERPGGLTVTVNRIMRISAYTESGNHKTAWFVSMEDGEERYLRILIDVTASACSGQGSFVETAAAALIFETGGIIDDPRFTYRTLCEAFDARTPVYIYEETAVQTSNVYVLTRLESDQGVYKATFLSSNFAESMVWSFQASDPDAVMDEV